MRTMRRDAIPRYSNWASRSSGSVYGMQLIAKDLGGRVEPARAREYGHGTLTMVAPSAILNGIRRVWMSHGDRILDPPPGFQVTAQSDTTTAAMEWPEKRIFGVQFPSRSGAYGKRHGIAPPLCFRYLPLFRKPGPLGSFLEQEIRASPRKRLVMAGSSVPSVAVWIPPLPLRWLRAPWATVWRAIFRKHRVFCGRTSSRMSLKRFEAT